MVEKHGDDTDKAAAVPFVAPCRQLAPFAPVGWLRLGWADMRRAWPESITYGVLMCLLSWLISLLAYQMGNYGLLLGVLSGFVFLGPVLAIGLYSISAALERQQKTSLRRTLRAEKRHIGNVMIFALILLVLFLVWARAASMVHIFFPIEFQQNWRAIVTFLGIGSAVGAVFAGITFMISAFSLPMIVHRDVDAVTAVVSSINAVLRNKLAMLVWSLLILLAVVVGFATAMLGFVITLPVIGFATWHGYLETIDASEFPRHKEGVTSTARPGED